MTSPEQLDEHLAGVDVTLSDDALDAAKRIAREIPYTAGVGGAMALG